MTIYLNFALEIVKKFVSSEIYSYFILPIFALGVLICIICIIKGIINV